MFASITNNLIIEFIPKEDSQVQKLLLSREYIFKDYNLKGFENAFKQYFIIKSIDPIKGTNRILYFLKTRVKHTQSRKKNK